MLGVPLLLRLPGYPTSLLALGFLLALGLLLGGLGGMLRKPSLVRAKLGLFLGGELRVIDDERLMPLLRALCRQYRREGRGEGKRFKRTFQLLITLSLVEAIPGPVPWKPPRAAPGSIIRSHGRQYWGLGRAAVRAAARSCILQ
jgi:hypothetical protein